MEVTNDDSCILCGKNNEHGLKLEFSYDNENHRAFTNVTIPKIFNGYNGVVHGGIVCALLDEANFYACRTLGAVTVTMTLNTKFKRPVPINTKLYLEGEVINKRSRSIVACSKLMLGDTVLATAQGEFFIKKQD